MSALYEPDYCPNCGEDFPCDCTQEQIDSQQLAAEAHYMRRWEQSMEEYEEDYIE